MATTMITFTISERRFFIAWLAGVILFSGLLLGAFMGGVEFGESRTFATIGRRGR